MLSIYPVPGTVFCVVHEPSNLIFPAPSSCSPLPLHLFGLWWGFTKTIHTKGRNKKVRRNFTVPPSCYTGLAGRSRPKEQPSCDWGASPSVNLPWVPTFAHILPRLPVFILFFFCVWQKWNQQAWHLNAYSSMISIVQARNMGEAAPTSLISRLENLKKDVRASRGEQRQDRELVQSTGFALDRTGPDSSSTTY